MLILRRFSNLIFLNSGLLLFLRICQSGATGNRTRDTRIFSPLLYRLSYGTEVLQNESAKIHAIFIFPKFEGKKRKKIIFRLRWGSIPAPSAPSPDRRG